MEESAIRRLRETIRDVPDFPNPGILFKDITPVLADPDCLRLAIDALVEPIGEAGIDKVIGIDARGFIFGSVVADRIGAGFVPMRKKGKLPYRTRAQAYALEYGDATLEVHEDAFRQGERVVLVDDLLATGGTAAAALSLAQSAKVDLVAAIFLIELGFLKGRRHLTGPVHSILVY